MAKIALPPVPYQIYRRFAVVTILLTATIAMFADDKNRAATESEIEQQAVAQEPTKSDKPTLERLPPAQSAGPSSFGDEPPAYGKPMIRAQTKASRYVAQQGQGQYSQRDAVPGYSRDYLDRLSEEEYLALVEGLRESGMLDPEERQQRIAALDRASLNRSGSATRPD